MEKIIVGGIYAVLLLTIFIYSSIAIKHAARFRYISPRTIWITLFFTGAMATLTIIGIITFFLIDWSAL